MNLLILMLVLGARKLEMIKGHVSKENENFFFFLVSLYTKLED